MKTSVSVIAIKSFEFKGQSYQPNQSIDLTPIDAVVLAKKHLITLTKRHIKAFPPQPEPVPVPEPVVEEPKKKRTYKRRDLQAEEMTEMTPVVEQAVDPAPIEDVPYSPYHDPRD